MISNKSNHKRLNGLLAILIMGISTIFTSCESYLDIDEYIYDRTTIDSVFVSKLKLIEYMNGTTAFLPAEGMLYRDETDSPGAAASDEFIFSWKSSTMRFLLNEITPESYEFSGTWSKMYKGIRKANIILERINECKDLTDFERRDYMGRAYFLRAYFYYTLLRHYGPVPILPDKAFDTDEAASNVAQERNTWDECVEYICQNMEQAANYLPAQRERAFEYVPTKGGALSIIARLRLYQASTWYNGNTRYSQWTCTDGRPFISQENNAQRWGIAAAAFKRIIDTNIYKLHTIERNNSTLPLPSTVSGAAFPNGAGDIDPYLSYKRIFDGSIMPSLNPELILYCPADHSISRMLAPAAIGGENSFNIPLAFIESYRMADGTEYRNATEAEKSWEPIGQAYRFSDEYTVGASVAYRDAYREPRFYASIGYNHCIWPGTSYLGTQPLTNFEVSYYKNGTGAPTGDANHYNRTGYTSRKFFNQEDNYFGWDWSRNRNKTVAIVRYAEILMGYVEAMNEMEGSYTDPATGISVTRNVEDIVKYFNMIRYRAGMPGITEAEAGDKEHMKHLIIEERKIEFAFEGHRYYDLRRWGIAQEYIGAPIYGYNVDASTSERQRFYTPVILDKEEIYRRTFNQKMYFYPIPKNTIERNRKLVQNPGWR